MADGDRSDERKLADNTDMARQISRNARENGVSRGSRG